MLGPYIIAAVFEEQESQACCLANPECEATAPGRGTQRTWGHEASTEVWAAAAKPVMISGYGSIKPDFFASIYTSTKSPELIESAMASSFRKESQVISFIVTDILGCEQKVKYCHELCCNAGGADTHAAVYLDLNLAAYLIFSYLYPVYKISEYYKRLNTFKLGMGLTFSLTKRFYEL